MADYHVLSLGAGVQSTTLYLMFMEGILTPQIDCAIFADTQEEPAAVYRHLDWLISLNGPKILVRTVGKLGDDLINGRNSLGGQKRKRTVHESSFASIPAFTTADGGSSVGITRRQCSREYKTDVIDRTIRREVVGLQPRQRVPRGTKVYQYIGMSFDEMGRASRVKKVFEARAKWSVPVFPLIDKFMTRANCINWLAGRIPHETPRSACVFCPYHSDHEWDRLRTEDPDGWARAVEVDHALRRDVSVDNRDMSQVMYLHRSCKPLDLVQLDTTPDPRKAQTTINFAAECMGMCGV